MVGTSEISLIVIFERRADGSFAARIEDIASVIRGDWDELSADLDTKLRESLWYLSETAAHRLDWVPSLETVRHR